ncbi:MAG: hypothetical protein Q8O55_07465 [Dehalococcoidales bacterium]|nr:hypothetical protein [Dehalococcoidales bacterium]
MPITIDKAIKNLTAAKKDAGMVPDEEWKPTIKLAVEALKRVKNRRDRQFPILGDELPGETLLH